LILGPRRSFRASAAVVIAVIGMWMLLFRVSDKHPEMMASLAGCYRSVDVDQSGMVNVTATGAFEYRGGLTSVVPYEDKQSLSFLPEAKVVVGSGGALEFLSGNPLLLRFGRDRNSFTVPSESGSGRTFEKGHC
jgi:hypothetical protein